MSDLQIRYVAAVNNREVLEKNLIASSQIQGRVEERLHFVEGAKSISEAYNKGIDHWEGQADILVFAHQDVYFPKGWEEKLLTEIKEFGNDWGIIGLVGVNYDSKTLGRSWSTGINTEIGADFRGVEKVRSVDEFVIVMNASKGVRFDQNLPSFHLYGTDIVQQFNEKNVPSYIINAPVIHNSTVIKSLGGGYYDAYKYLQKKWRSELPLQTPCSRIEPFPYRYFKLRFKIAMRRVFEDISRPEIDPVEKAVALGYE